MTDLHRIEDDADAPEAELRLIRSAALDVPPAHGKARLLTALGVGSVTTAAAAATGATATTSVVVSKWLALGALAGTLATGSLEAVKMGLDARSTPAPVIGAADRPRKPVAPSIAAPAVPVPVVAEEPARLVPLARREIATAPPRTAAPSAVVSTLPEEIAAIDGARRLLQSGDARAALRALDDYATAFAHPALSPEARLLRLEVLVALGKREEARRLGELLLATDPANAHAQRVRSVLRQSGFGGAEIRSPYPGH